MEKDWYDKYSKEFHCADCTFLDSCLKKDEPLYSRCCEQYLRDRIAELEEQLKNVMPFKTGQTLYSLNKRTNCIYELTFEQFMYKARRLKDGYVSNYSKEELSTTKEEAQAKLEELSSTNGQNE